MDWPHRLPKKALSNAAPCRDFQVPSSRLRVHDPAAPAAATATKSSRSRSWQDSHLFVGGLITDLH